MGFGYFLNKYISKEKLNPHVTKQKILEQWLNLAKMRQNWRLEGPAWATNALVSGMWPSVMTALPASWTSCNSAPQKTAHTWAYGSASQMANRHMKRWETPLTIRETQIKATTGHHPTPVRVAVTTKSAKKCWRGCGKKGTLRHCWCWCKLVHPPRKTGWRLLKNLKTELPCDPVIPLLGR